MTLVVSADPERCELHGECVISAPEIFVIEEGADAVTVVLPRPGEELRSQALDASYACPMQAIDIMDE